ncbi:hypothetical protein GYH30_034862 [Glycine max]|nr:hypothetical protein GYH30_034862 [Glycine max]
MTTPASTDDGGGNPPPNGVLVPHYQNSVEPVIRGHYLHHFIVSLQIPERFATPEDRDSGCVILECHASKQQDQLLLSWLQSPIFAPMLRKFIGCTSSWLLWDNIHHA